MTSLQSVGKWLQDYVAAWYSYDPDAIGALFSDDAECRFNPFDEPYVGRDEIVESWLEDPDEKGTYQASYKPIAVNGNTAVARGRTTYYESGTRNIDSEYDNIFILEFNDAGECTNFCEWYMAPSEESEEE